MDDFDPDEPPRWTWVWLLLGWAGGAALVGAIIWWTNHRTL